MTEVASQPASNPPETISPREVLLLFALGHSHSELAVMSGLSERSIRTMLDTPMAQNEIAKLEVRLAQQAEALDGEDLARSILTRAKVPAARRIVSTILSPDEKTALSASEKVLGYAGISPIQKTQHVHTIELPEAQASLIQETLAMHPVLDVLPLLPAATAAPESVSEFET